MTSIMSDNDSTHNTSLEKQNEKCLDRLLTPIFRVNSEESLARNRKFLKDLELAKARLRTYAAYTPTDRELQQRATEYRKYLQKYIRNFAP
ncbi:uncharacterized protein LOC100742511 [Bombus impatiens]|uniref:Uncharacterized protein LOC117206049 n=2 Tax=Pyrobombus TaxID=144703 RepID=A0A6P8MGU3_9HYME|nr:uncharacterized protein LOC100742511 [Bombus impatiens]XP_033184750.1 uncharacterized protein LOC117154147 [Bombus vancouverensis nearcticus]XP_033300927.1 uncharacterized protein LOC117206049 [Bombus bifarius]